MRPRDKYPGLSYEALKELVVMYRSMAKKETNPLMRDRLAKKAKEFEKEAQQHQAA